MTKEKKLVAGISVTGFLVFVLGFALIYSIWGNREESTPMTTMSDSVSVASVPDTNTTAQAEQIRALRSQIDQLEDDSDLAESRAIARFRAEWEAEREAAEKQRLKDELAEARAELERVRVEIPDSASALGQVGSGKKTREDLGVRYAEVYSFSEPMPDDKFGELILPNYREGRGFTVHSTNSPLPVFRYNVPKPEGFNPAIHPTKGKDGERWVVFVKETV